MPIYATGAICFLVYVLLATKYKTVDCLLMAALWPAVIFLAAVFALIDKLDKMRGVATGDHRQR
jgi:hypothetical protein